MAKTHDTVVIGGGLAGLTAARELSLRGRDVLLLEARDRLGGRTWTQQVGDDVIELGAGYVHWLQPWTWAELRRYGLGILPTARAKQFLDMSGGQVREGAYGNAVRVIVDAVVHAGKGSRRSFAGPFDLSSDSDRMSVDAQSLDERMSTFDGEPADLPLARGIVSAFVMGALEQSSTANMHRWIALSGHDPRLFLDIESGYRIRGGTGALIDSIKSDTAAEIALSSPVTSVEVADDAVTVTTVDGAEHRARTVICAVPVNTLKNITWAPALDGALESVALEGQASCGAKFIARVAGSVPILALGDERSELTTLQVDHEDDVSTWLIGFTSHARLAATPEAGAAAVKAVLPNADIMSVHVQDWLNDPYSQGAAAVLRPGHLTRMLQQVTGSDSRLLFAGGDVAVGWGGYMDGAIESGITTAMRALKISEN